jgi:hypothetical protein
MKTFAFTAVVKDGKVQLPAEAPFTEGNVIKVVLEENEAKAHFTGADLAKALSELPRIKIEGPLPKRDELYDRPILL